MQKLITTLITALFLFPVSRVAAQAQERSAPFEISASTGLVMMGFPKGGEASTSMPLLYDITCKSKAGSKDWYEGFQYTPIGLTFGKSLYGLVELGYGPRFFPLRIGIGYRF